MNTVKKKSLGKRIIKFLPLYIMLIPGLAFTNGVKNVFVGDTISGTVRIIETALCALALAFGFVLAGWLVGV